MQRGHREHLTSPWPHLLRLSTTSGPRPLQPQAFQNQGPQAIAATGFLNPNVHPDKRQIAWTPLQCRVAAKQ